MLKKYIPHIKFSIGILLTIWGILLAIINHNKYFYIIFSLGLLIITWKTYNKISKRKFFNNFKPKHKIIFWATLIISSIIIDYIGTLLGYWTGAFFTSFEMSMKYIFQWAIPFMGIMFFILIGKEIFQRKFPKTTSLFLSIIIFGTILGFFMEYLNQFSQSWIILKMPLTNQRVGQFFLIFQTVGYWIMGMIPYTLHLIIKKIFKIQQ